MLVLDQRTFGTDSDGMPRKLRLEYPGAMYHVMSRGDQRDDISTGDVDRHDFIKDIGRSLPEDRVAGACVLFDAQPLSPGPGNPNANLVSGMAGLQSTYTIRLNHRHKLTGHVLSGRYEAQLVEGSGNGYLRAACDYIHLNPVRAKVLTPEDRLLAYPWSSFPWYLAVPDHRPRWLRVDRLLGEHGIQRDTPAGRQEFERHMERRRLEEMDPKALQEFRQVWCLGSEAFQHNDNIRCNPPQSAPIRCLKFFAHLLTIPNRARY